MPATYQVRVYSTAGILQAVFDDFFALTIEHRVNYASTMTLSMYELRDAVQYFTLDAIIEVRRRVTEADLDWYTEYVGFHRTPQRQLTPGSQRIFTSYSRGLLDLINRRTVRYYADTDGSAKGPAPADDVIKDYVRENAGSLATIANHRVTDGRTQGLSVATNRSLAPNYEGAHAWDNLLTVIRDIGEPNHVDFDVAWLGGTQSEFRTHYPFLGTDRRYGIGAEQVVFSPGLGNMINPSYTQSRTDEISSVLVLGPGEGPLRDTTLRTSAYMAASPWNLIEQNQDASGEDRTNALNAIGDGVLHDKRPAVSFTFETIQTPQTTYGKHYKLGDLVTGRFSNIEAHVKVRAVTVNITVPVETVSLELEEYTD